jgi:putative transposase
MTSLSMWEQILIKTLRSLKSPFVMQEYPLHIRNPISNVKLNIYKNNFRNIKSSRTSGQALIGTEKAYKPWWNKSSKEKSKKLWLPTLTDCQDSDLTCYNGSLENLTAPSWFSTRLQTPILKSSYQKTSFQCSPTSLPKIMESDLLRTEKIELLKSRKIKLYPTTQQKQKLDLWFGASRWTYNQSLNYINQIKRNDIKKGIKPKIPKIKTLRKLFINGNDIKEFANNTPYEIRDAGARDVIKNIISNCAKIRKGSLKKFELKYRKKKDLIQTLAIRSKDYGRKKGDYSILTEIKKSEPIDKYQVYKDFRIIKDSNGYYWMCLPIKKAFNGERQACKVTNDGLNTIVSLDPGVRTFLVGYDPHRKHVIHIGENGIKKIGYLCYRLDNLISEQSKCKNRKKVRLRKAIRRIRTKIKNRIKDMHYKIANFLCKNYQTILLPKFETQQMVSKLHSKVARGMMTLSHYSFRERLKEKSIEYGNEVIMVTEEYTSKTCGRCGTMNTKLGGSKCFKCPNCKMVMDRDCNGARNILIKNI